MTIEEIAIPVVRSYCPDDGREWEDLVARSYNGTFLHTRRFISYHATASVIGRWSSRTAGSALSECPRPRRLPPTPV
jgi:hypothetical protein